MMDDTGNNTAQDGRDGARPSRDSTLNAMRAHLLAQRCEAGYWRGELSSSALATAVAVVALHVADGVAHAAIIARALQWLAITANQDGGWGDTPSSPSNLSTTLLCRAALSCADHSDSAMAAAAGRADRWIERVAGDLSPESISAAILASYGDDRTFSAPILTVCALTGRLGDDPWRFVPQLPFELSVVPQSLFRFVNLSVVSYAIPALIAIGIVRHRHGRRNATPASALREAFIPPALRVLAHCQPRHGGFLEAVPLTAFVAASLAAAGYRDHPVTEQCIRFITTTIRADGSWPIDTNLATWLTTLSINALADAGDTARLIIPAERDRLRTWLLDQQTTKRHPYTGAAPGAWGWTSLAGAVPDADDTAGALLALRSLDATDPRGYSAAIAGLRWLLGVQNSDGGIPTFCRGWGKQPFDRSSPDITAHVMRAFDAWYPEVDHRLRIRLDRSLYAAVQYLGHTQKRDGSWIPLWFGNQHAAGHANPTYGTALVVRALAGISPGRLPSGDMLSNAGVKWLLSAQNNDGGWGGAVGVPSTIEETAVAVTALRYAGVEDAAGRGIEWLIAATDGGVRFKTAPIGLYFSRLWYSERLYPVIFSVQALSIPDR